VRAASGGRGWLCAMVWRGCVAWGMAAGFGVWGAAEARGRAYCPPTLSLTVDQPQSLRPERVDEVSAYGVVLEAGRLYRLLALPEADAGTLLPSYELLTAGCGALLMAGRVSDTQSFAATTLVHVKQDTQAVLRLRTLAAAGETPRVQLGLYNLGPAPDDFDGFYGAGPAVGVDGAPGAGSLDFQNDADNFTIRMAGRTLYAVEVRVFGEDAAAEANLLARAVATLPSEPNGEPAEDVASFRVGTLGNPAGVWSTMFVYTGDVAEQDYDLTVTGYSPSMPASVAEPAGGYEVRAFAVWTAPPVPPPGQPSSNCAAPQMVGVSAPSATRVAVGPADGDAYLGVQLEATRLYQITVGAAPSAEGLRVSVLSPECGDVVLDNASMSVAAPTLAVGQGGVYRVRLSSPFATVADVRVVDLGPASDDHAGAGAGATELPANGQPVAGVLDYADDMDGFRLNLLPGAVYRVSVQGPSGGFPLSGVLDLPGSDPLGGPAGRVMPLQLRLDLADPPTTSLTFVVPPGQITGPGGGGGRGGMLGYRLRVARPGVPCMDSCTYSVSLSMLSAAPATAALTAGGPGSTCGNPLGVTVNAGPAWFARMDRSRPLFLGFAVQEGRLYQVNVPDRTRPDAEYPVVVAGCGGAIANLGSPDFSDALTAQFVARSSGTVVIAVSDSSGPLASPAALAVSVVDLGPAADDAPDTAAMAGAGPGLALGQTLTRRIDFPLDTDVLTFQLEHDRLYRVDLSSDVVGQVLFATSTPTELMRPDVNAVFGGPEFPGAAAVRQRVVFRTSPATGAVAIGPGTPPVSTVLCLQVAAAQGAPLDSVVGDYTVRVTELTCPADIVTIGGARQPDGDLTGDDFVAFVGAFAGGDALADITGVGGLPALPDGLLTGDDFVTFVSAFASGCP